MRPWKDLPPLWDVKGWLQAILSRRRHPVLQFLRYGLAGVLAMAANLLIFTLSEQFLFPIEAPEGGVVVSPPDGVGDLWAWFTELTSRPSVFNFFRCNTLAFLGANGVAYLLNFTWVFEGGRHSRRVEILLFLLVSLISFTAGTALASVLVGTYGLNEYVAKIADVIAAILLNFVCRKFLVFQN